MHRTKNSEASEFQTRRSFYTTNGAGQSMSRAAVVDAASDPIRDDSRFQLSQQEEEKIPENDNQEKKLDDVSRDVDMNFSPA